jgi:hypothetical protein
MKSILFALILATPGAFAGSVDEAAVLKWATMVSTKLGYTLKGTSTSNLPCELDLTNESITNWNQYYISLGTSPSATDTNDNDYTWIGTFINPESSPEGIYQLNAMNITNNTVHINVVQSEAGYERGPITEDLLIQLDAQGYPTQVQGTSSQWPNSTCVLSR